MYVDVWIGMGMIVYICMSIYIYAHFYSYYYINGCFMNTQVSQNCLAEAKDYPDVFREVCPSSVDLRVK